MIYVAKKKWIERKFTKELFQEALKEIGWSIMHVGCDHYRIVNHLGKSGDLEFMLKEGSVPEMRCRSKGVFGSEPKRLDGPGLLLFNLSRCGIEVGYWSRGETADCVSLFSLRDPNKIFISFYNHSDNKRGPGTLKDLIKRKKAQ